MSNWQAFARLGDEFFVEYSNPNFYFAVPKLFLVGHAAELYLKAAHIKIFGTVKAAINHQHKVMSLFMACKDADESFMPSYQLRPSLVDVEKFENWSIEDQKAHLPHQEFYMIARWEKNLKYLGLRDKHGNLQHPKSYTFISQNPYWINFFKELRSYLKYPENEDSDFIKTAIELHGMPEASQVYLASLYNS